MMWLHSCLKTIQENYKYGVLGTTRLPVEARKGWSLGFWWACVSFKTHRRAEAKGTVRQIRSGTHRPSGEGARHARAVRGQVEPTSPPPLRRERDMKLPGCCGGIYFPSCTYHWDLNCLMTYKFRMKRAHSRKLRPRGNTTSLWLWTHETLSSNSDPATY